MAGFLVLAIVSAVASGGGRELLHREHAVIYPVSPTTDHLGALLLAPLNIAWLLQAWILLGITAYGVERRSLLPAADRHASSGSWPPPRSAQVVAWTVEAVRRTRARHRDRPRARPGAGRGRGAAPADAATRSGSSTRCTTRWIVVGLGRRVPVALGGVDRRLELALLVVAVVLGADPGPPRRPPRAARRAAGRDRQSSRPPAPALAAGHAGAHRPGLGLARRADAPRPRRARDRARRRGAGRQPDLAADDDPAGPGGLRRCAAVRCQRLVPRRPRRPVAGEPAGRPASCLRRSGVGARRVPAGRVARDHGAGRASRRAAERRGARPPCCAPGWSWSLQVVDVGDALVVAATVRRRPALGARDPGAARW